jgi:anti-sigma factor RsiW
MSCDKTDNIFSLYDGALCDEEREAAELHLKKCGECRRAIADWKAVAGVLFQPHNKFISPDFAGRVISRIKPQERRGYRFLRALRARLTVPRLAAAGAAAIALLLCISRFFPVSRSAGGVEGTAFVAELIAGDIPETDGYGQASEYILGS